MLTALLTILALAAAGGLFWLHSWLLSDEEKVGIVKGWDDFLNQ